MQLMELLSMHAFPLNNKYHIEVVGEENVFNLCHARLRNVIERAFGVVKARFPILKKMAPYSFAAQTKIVMTCFSIHNFLRQVSVANRLFSEYDTEE